MSKSLRLLAADETCARLAREADKILAAADAAAQTPESKAAARVERKMEEILSKEAPRLLIEIEPTAADKVEEESDRRYEDSFPQEREYARNEAARLQNIRAKIEASRLTAIPEPHTAQMYSAELQGLDVALRRSDSEKETAVLTARYVWLSEKLGRKKTTERLARKAGLSRRTVERRVREGQRLLVNIVQIAAKFDALPELVFDVMVGLPAELQNRVAHEAERQSLIWQIEAERSPPRARRLDEGILKALDGLGRNTADMRATLARMSPSVQDAEIARMRRISIGAEKRAASIERSRDEARAIILTPAADALGAVYAAATPADRARFMEVHGLRRARTIPGEDISIAFDVVEETESAHA